MFGISRRLAGTVISDTLESLGSTSGSVVYCIFSGSGILNKTVLGLEGFNSEPAAKT
jgi:hypothetical protein